VLLFYFGGGYPDRVIYLVVFIQAARYKLSGNLISQMRPISPGRPGFQRIRPSE